MQAILRQDRALAFHITLFAYLQVLDFLTTLVGFRLGLGEASPFIRVLTSLGPVWGVLLSKIVAFSIAGVALYLHRDSVIRKINIWYGALVIWNLGLILLAPSLLGLRD
jgi:hypothetical protein